MSYLLMISSKLFLPEGWISCHVCMSKAKIIRTVKAQKIVLRKQKTKDRSLLRRLGKHVLLTFRTILESQMDSSMCRSIYLERHNS